MISGLAGIALGPFPFAHQLGGEGVPVDVAFGIAARAGIAVPIPGAADATAGFQRLHRQAKTVAQAQELVESGEAGADHQRVEFGGLVGSLLDSVVASAMVVPPSAVSSGRSAHAPTAGWDKAPDQA